MKHTPSNKADWLIDLRSIIGLFFSLIGCILLGTAALLEPGLVMGFPLNTIMGIVLIAFGGAMLCLGYFGFKIDQNKT